MNARINRLNIVNAFLGLLGAGTSLIIGFYLLSTILNLSSIQGETSQSWIVSLVTLVTVMGAAYASYAILGGNAQRGGKINMANGTVSIVTYLYFPELSQPKLLDWLNPVGIALVIPSILSGIICLGAGSKNSSRRH
jgi:hypothetical protein